MFDIGATELLLVAIVALVIIGPKDLPVALRAVGRVLGQLRSITGQFRFSLDEMVREAEMEEREKEWAQKNADIMAQHPQAPDDGTVREPIDEADYAEPEVHDGTMKPQAPDKLALEEKPSAADESESAAEVEPVAPDANAPEPSDQDDLFGDKR